MDSVSRGRVIALAREAFGEGRRPTMEDVAERAGVSVRTLYRMFGSRETLLGELDCEAAPPPRDRVLEAALALVGRDGLAALSMDELATASGVSRATLYRLFPGKPALFEALIRTYSPWESVVRVIESAPGAPPEQVIPKVGKALVRSMSGRTGVLFRLVFEMARGEPETARGVRAAMARGLPDMIQYLSEQMEAGRLRRMHPVLAFQLLAGPIVAHLATRPLAALIGFRASSEEVANEVVQAWLRAMALSASPRARRK